MRTADYDDDRRWCARCRVYVRYLLSPQGAWCTGCGGRVVLFSDEDRARFERELRRFRSTFDPGELEYA